MLPEVRVECEHCILYRIQYFEIQYRQYDVYLDKWIYTQI
ncbi:MAG: hypothetical protein NVS2B12_33070 [Ktedonobacteraceae bacterium]